MLSLLAAAALATTLPQVQERLAEERAAAQKLAAREATLLGKLADLERQIELEERALRAAQMKLRAANARLALAEERSNLAQGRVERAMATTGPHLAARYRLGREGYLRFLLGARSVGDLLRRRRLFNALLQSDLAALAVLRVSAEDARSARDELAAAKAEVKSSADAEAERKKSLLAIIDEQRTLLLSLQQEKALHEEAVRELEQAERDLSRKLVDIQKDAPAVPRTAQTALTASIRRARGKLRFPLEQGKVEAHFGRAIDPRFGTVTVQNGIDVRAPLGAAVRAIWAGRVAHAGWFKGFGNLLIVDHGEGVFSLMAHLDRLEKAVGDDVRAGDEVGTVGDTGSLKGPYLYFELRDGQKPLDPERWLSRRRKPAPVLLGASGGAAK